MSNRIEIGHGIALQFSRAETGDGNTTPTDVWVQFSGADGKSASVSIASLAERSGGVIGAGLRSWASDRINEHLAGRR